MSTEGVCPEIIILSDDDDDDDEEPGVSCVDNSVLIVEMEVEEEKKNDVVLSPAALDQDLVVTFSRRAEVLPHARYDCPTHPFTATEQEVVAPVAGNTLICEQCFCYICDKLASECVVWQQSGVCHCNSHKRSAFWNNQRNSKLLGGLKSFNITLCELDAQLRRADTMLQDFKLEISRLYATYLKGQTFQEFGLNVENQQELLIFDYSPVCNAVSSFLAQADKASGKAAAVMRLGAAEVFLPHFQSSRCYTVQSPKADVQKAKIFLLHRILSSVQRQVVMENFSAGFINKLHNFFTKILPHELKHLKFNLCIRAWDNILLVSVLKGQNVSGFRKDKGKKDILIEQTPVVLNRVRLLQQQHRYRELCRYLRVVKSNDEFSPLQDLLPFFMCLAGEFPSACLALLPADGSPRLTPQLFRVYLRILDTAAAPRLHLVQHVDLCRADATWEPIKDVVPMKRMDLLKFVFRVHKRIPEIFDDSECWTHLLKLFNSPPGSDAALPAPDVNFLREAKDIVNSILLKPYLQIPAPFQAPYPEQALLLVMTGALGDRIRSAALSPALPVLNTFRANPWALWWLWDTMSSTVDHLNSFSKQINKEVENEAGAAVSLPFQRQPLDLRQLSSC